MNALETVRERFTVALAEIAEQDRLDSLLAMIRPAQDGKFGDYQANCAMPLGKLLGRAPREIAAELVSAVQLDDLCEVIEVAGPGFINLTLRDDWIKRQLSAALTSDTLGIVAVDIPRTVVVDFSSPNVAKSMHVGHIRSTFIGDALAKIHRFLGHKVITDNHIGDWGTQFGMIIYGYKHFVVEAAYDADPISELGRLYKFVRKVMDYHAAVAQLPQSAELLQKQQQALARIESQDPADKASIKKQKKDLARLGEKIAEQQALVGKLESILSASREDAEFLAVAEAHADIGQSVLEETVRLHEGDAVNKGLWDKFLPYCLADINRLYDRLNIRFDHVFGESFYHDQLSGVVEGFLNRDLATVDDGAICVFLDGYETPMIIRKKDGAFLYSTTDLATIQYRINEWQPDAMLYVVDHRQADHFDKLFAAARQWGHTDTELTHVSFGTVLGDDGKPFKTRSGDAVGLEGLLDEAESRALAIARDQNPDLDEIRQREIARVVGIGALKYADLSQNRSSDYKFSYEKMLALRGNTATYLQYANARVHGIMRNLGVSAESLRSENSEFIFTETVERQLSLQLLRFSETLNDVLVEYKPNLLCNYLFDLAQLFARFFDQCPVRDASSESEQRSRLQLCALTSAALTTGLELLGIESLERI